MLYKSLLHYINEYVVVVIVKVVVCEISDALTVSIWCECTASSQGNGNVVDCSKAVLKEHSYWPLVSDIINLFSHRDVALYFMSDTTLLTHWASIMACFQGLCCVNLITLHLYWSSCELSVLQL